ncbi:ECF transporter S component [Holzapfeliella floricola]|uniref:ECF transporter S component n=1 Tax=Holzapfeliella floricola TaxID=679249 RepID=UPI001A910B40
MFLKYIFRRIVLCLKKNRYKKIIVLALFGAVSLILMQFEFPIIPMFPYLKFDFSDIMVVIGGGLFGPVGAVLTAVIKVFLNFVLFGGNVVSLIGMSSSLLASLAFALPLTVTLKNDTTWNWIKSSGLSVLSLTVLLSVGNWLIFTPLYINLLNFNLGTSLVNYVLTAIVPFNLVKGVILSITSVIVYRLVITKLKRMLEVSNK